MNIKFIVERHFDGYIAYPLGIHGVVAGQGNSYLEALNDAKSALKFHIETFGQEVLDNETAILEAFIEEEAFV
jgi:predicted RNase H-like HicB family nuclease